MRTGRRIAIVVGEVMLAAVLVVGAWLWASGWSPRSFIRAVRGAHGARSSRHYELVPLGWGELSAVSAIGNQGQVTGMGDAKQWHRGPLVWSNGRTTPCCAGDGWGRAVGVDDLGRVAYSFQQYNQSQTEAFVLTPDEQRLPLVGPRPDCACRATAMNPIGTVVGVTVPPGEQGRPCMWDRAGGVTVLDVRPGCAMAINDAGVIAGYILDASGKELPQVWEPVGEGYRADCRVSPLEIGCRPYAINNQGVVVGAIGHTVPFRQHPPDRVESLPLPGRACVGVARDLNDRGEIVGHGYIAGVNVGVVAAVLWGLEGMVDLNDCIDPAYGWHLIRATAINNDGLIACDAMRDGGSGAVLLVPHEE